MHARTFARSVCDILARGYSKSRRPIRVSAARRSSVLFQVSHAHAMMLGAEIALVIAVMHKGEALPLNLVTECRALPHRSHLTKRTAHAAAPDAGSSHVAIVLARVCGESLLGSRVGAQLRNVSTATSNALLSSPAPSVGALTPPHRHRLVAALGHVRVWSRAKNRS